MAGYGAMTRMKKKKPVSGMKTKTSGYKSVASAPKNKAKTKVKAKVKARSYSYGRGR